MKNIKKRENYKKNKKLQILNKKMKKRKVKILWLKKINLDLK